MSSFPSIEQHVGRTLEACGLLDARLVLALSGGVDSIVLLDVLAQLASRHRFALRCLHVDHGISPCAGQWAQFCVQRCATYGIACTVVKTDVGRQSGQSLEAAAREARYAVFRAQRADAVVLAHHLDDQAETLLLQLLRGAGAAGLAAMPLMRTVAADAPALFRPLLDCSRAHILEYARRRDLRWVDDESNARDGFDRNFLRLEVLPGLGRRFPGWRQTLARSARNLAEAQMLLEEMACDDAGGAAEGNRLPLDVMRKLSPARARNALRWFIARRGERAPGRRRLQAGIDQLLAAQPDRQPRLELEAGALCRHADCIVYVRHAPPVPAAWQLPWTGEEPLTLPHALGSLCLRPARGEGLRRDVLDAGLSVRLRSGGERMQPDRARPVRALKDLLREAGLPPWERRRIPLLFCADALCWVPRLGADCRFAAGPDEAGLVPEWQPGGGAEGG